MNILVLNGSPRKNGNTAAMVEAFKEGAESAGHGVVVKNVGRMKIAGCIACEYCHTKGNGVCAQKDDMAEVTAELKKADMLVLAAPIYYFTMCGQLQCTIDRFYALGRMDNIKKTALLLSSESPNVYDGAIAQDKDMIGYLGMKDVGIITAHGSENKSEKKLAEIKEFARGI